MTFYQWILLISILGPIVVIVAMYLVGKRTDRTLIEILLGIRGLALIFSLLPLLYCLIRVAEVPATRFTWVEAIFGTIGLISWMAALTTLALLQEDRQYGHL